MEFNDPQEANDAPEGYDEREACEACIEFADDVSMALAHGRLNWAAEAAEELLEAIIFFQNERDEYFGIPIEEERHAVRRSSPRLARKRE